MSLLVTNQKVPGIVDILHKLPDGDVIAVDCETTGLHPYQGDRLRGFSFAIFSPVGKEGEIRDIFSYYVPVGYPTGNLDVGPLRELCRAIKGRNPLYVYHHAKFDLRFLRQLPRDTDGSVFFPVPEPHKLWDTKQVAWLLDENMGTSLDEQAKFHLNEEKSPYMRDLRLIKGKEALVAAGVRRPKMAESLDRGWSEITAAETAEYGAKDAELTLRLACHQMAMLYQNHPTVHGHPAPDIEREMEVMGVLLRMEDTGILVDTGRLAELLEAAETEVDLIRGNFITDYGIDINSNKQLGELLYDTLELEPPSKTPGGARSVNRQALEMLVGQTTLITDLLKHRRLSKAISGYLVPLLKFADAGGRIHPTFWQTGTVTGRFSCSDPNLQTIPRSDTLVGVREVFVAEPGMELWEFDLQAAELRVLAGMAGEENLIRQLEDGVDMHSENAAAIFGANFTPLQRRAAKNIMYGWSYGLTKRETASKYITSPEVSYEQAMKIADQVLTGIKKLYPKIFKLMNATTREADKVGYVRTHDRAWPGRYRRFVTESQRQPRTYTALNAKVQGGIGEFMKDVMVAVEQPLASLGARLCLQVHDSLVIEVPEGDGEKVGVILQEAADLLNPFEMRMIFDGKPWTEHD